MSRFLRHTTKLTIAVTGLAVMILASTSARADVVGPPEENCPNGSEGETCHGGPHCRPLTCTDDTQCTDGRTCRELQLCIADIDCGSHGMSSVIDQVTGTCGGSSSCDQGECQTVRVCADPDDGSGCRATSTRAPGRSLGLALLVGLAILGLRRSWRR